MLKRNKTTLILSSLVVLLPILVGVLLWDALPAQMTTHWGADGVADGWSSRPFAVFALPLILLPIHLLCVFITGKDPKNKDQSGKLLGIMYWVIPVISLFSNAMVYAAAFGKQPDWENITFLLLGLTFLIIGNYLPKCKQNYTLGIKLKWTLENEENWNATHRFGGKVWVIGGIFFLFGVFLPLEAVPAATIILVTLMVLLPTLYSYSYHKKQLQAGTATAVPMPRKKTVTALSMAMAAAVLLLVGVLTFTGSIQMQYGESSFTVKASYWDDLTVDYAAIDHLEYRTELVKGIRTFGFGSPKLSLGSFKNEEFGAYTLYAYTRCKPCVVLYVGERILVLSGADVPATDAIYQELTARMS